MNMGSNLQISASLIGAGSLLTIVTYGFERYGAKKGYYVETAHWIANIIQNAGPIALVVLPINQSIWKAEAPLPLKLVASGTCMTLGAVACLFIDHASKQRVMDAVSLNTALKTINTYSIIAGAFLKRLPLPIALNLMGVSFLSAVIDHQRSKPSN